MSAPEPGAASALGSQDVDFHSLFHGNAYSRAGENGMKPYGPGLSGAVRASAVRAALPSVVKVGVPVEGIASHGPREALLLIPRSQPAASRKQPVIRVSVAL